MRLRNIVIALFTVSAAGACATGGGSGSRYGAATSGAYPSSYSASQAAAQRSVASRYDDRTILQAQRALGAKGYDVGTIDGIWGPDSQSALENFQRTRGMQPTGRLDDQALAALDVQASGGERNTASDAGGNAGNRGSNARGTYGNASSANAGDNGSERAQGGSGNGYASGEQGGADASAGPNGSSRLDRSTIREAQRALGDKGYDVGPIDGIWGPRSRSALESFEQAQGLQANGHLDRQALDALDVNAGNGGEDRAGSGASDNASASGSASGQANGLQYPQSTRRSIHRSQELNDPGQDMRAGGSSASDASSGGGGSGTSGTYGYVRSSPRPSGANATANDNAGAGSTDHDNPNPGTGGNA